VGYRTYFEFSYSNGDGRLMADLPPDVLRFLEEDVDGCTAIELDPQYILDAIEESSKWYHYDEDMVKLSKKFPQYRFILFGDGEESLDVWRKMYGNGQCILYQYVDKLPDVPSEMLKFGDK